MSAMLRANKAGGSAAKSRHARAYSISDGSSSGGSSDSEDAGARLSAASLDDSPPRVRFSSITEEFRHVSVASSVASGDSDRATTSSPFQLGKQPDDVFTTTPLKPALKPSQGLTSSSIMDPFIEHMSQSPRRATEERHVSRPATTPSVMALATPADRAFRTPSSRHEIGGVDAQGIYPPSACVFIANLPESKDDRALEAAVTREFSRFGTVFVKIRREVKGGMTGMPYAFAQYTNDEDAKMAMEEGRGIVILGRPCRTEMVKANRTFVIYSRRGEEITTDIAREILEPYGELSKCEMLSAQMQEAMDLPTAVLVEFAKFDPKRDLNSAVRQYDGYRIDAFDVKKRSPISRTDADEEFLRKYDEDRRSIFVSGLPLDAQRQEVVEFFSAIDNVISCNVVARPNYNGNVNRVFAFVEFTRADAPDAAIHRFNNFFYRGGVLKVERKVFRHVGTPRRVKSQAFSVRSSATPKTPRTAPGTASTPQHSYNNAGAGQPFAPLGYPAPSPAAVPGNGRPLVGASGLPVTPSSAAFGPNAFSYAGGFWPGMTITQDPVTGHTYWVYNPPATPTRDNTASGQHFFRA